MGRKDVIFFDLDGTLTDSKEGIFQSLQYALHFMGINEQDEKKLSLFLGPPLMRSFMKFYQMSEAEANIALTKYREKFSTEGIYQLSMYPGIEEMLCHIKERGMTVCLSTSKPLKYAEQILKRLRIDRYFDFLGGATMDESRTAKKDVIRYVMEQNGFDKERILMVGDRENDVLGAFQNCIAVLGVLYGYGSKKELEKAGCRFFAESVQDVENFILNQIN